MRIRHGMDGADRPPADAHVAGETRSCPPDQGHNGPPQGDAQHIHDLEAIARLPAVFRSAMILSYLEGFSTAEIAHLAGVQPQAIESLLVRGRELMQEEFLAYLRRNEDLDESEERIPSPVGTLAPAGTPSPVGSVRT